MPDLLVPAATSAPGELADWLECQALVSVDRNSSIQDLASALRRTGSGEEIEDERRIDDEDDATFDRGGETIEPVATDAFEEIEDRAASCGEAYPFEVLEGALQGRRSTPSSLYVFLLLLSKFGKDAGPDQLNVPQMFEEIAELAIAHTLGGESNEVATIQFGFPRRIAPPGFRAAVDDLCIKTGEGGKSRDQPNRSDQKDAALDVVAWRPFPDRRRGLVMAWGQCATGADWREKLTDLNPSDWAASWLMDRPAVIPMPAFFVPHRIDREHWDVTANYGGILFDRCRIALSSHPLPEPLRSQVAGYNRQVIKEKLAS